MEQLQKELTEKFGAEAWYSEITVLSPTLDETMIRVKETKDPNSLKGKTWVKESDSWIPSDDVLFQFNDGKPENHLFQLNKKVTIQRLVQLIDTSKKSLRQKSIDDAVIHFVSIQSAQMVINPARRVLYNISFQSKDRDRSYSFIYDLNGKLISFNR